MISNIEYKAPDPPSQKKDTKKYTQKQIEQGFKEWLTDIRLNPNLVVDTKEWGLLSVDEASCMQAESLIAYIK